MTQPKLCKDKAGFERYSPEVEARLRRSARAAGIIRLGAGRGAYLPMEESDLDKWQESAIRMHKNQTVITLDDKPTENTFMGRFRTSVTQLNYSDLPIVEPKAEAEQEEVQDYHDYIRTIRFSDTKDD